MTEQLLNEQCSQLWKRFPFPQYSAIWSFTVGLTPRMRGYYLTINAV